MKSSPARSSRCSARLLALVFLGVLALLFLATRAHAAEQLYTCGMHPQIIKHEPGNCPICGMKLTPIRSNAGGAAAVSGERKVLFYRSTMNPGETRSTPGNDSMGMAMEPVYDDAAAAGSASAIHIDAATVQRMNLKTGRVTQGPVRRTLRAVGTVAYNEAGLQDITTKYEGWIENLHVATTWTKVKAGEPLFDMYSPDLYNAQLNYVVAARGEGEAGGPLSRAALARLQLFDVPEAFIRQLAETQEPQRIFTFRAPSDGVVIEKMAVQGQMTKPGERIYRIADLRSVWVEAQIYENDLAFVHAGQPATVRVTYGAAQELPAEVSLILPQVSEQTRTATARLVVPNESGTLRPGMFVDVLFSAQIADSAVLVPDVAVLRSGEHNTVFIARDDGSFEPREIQLGARSEGGFYQVLSGLTEGERVVTSGQFMLDSESQLREAIQKMMKADAGASPATSSAAADGATLQPAGSEERVGSPRPQVPATSATTELKALVLIAADATAALGNDDLAAYRERLPAVRDALKAFLAADPHAAHGALGSAASALADPADLAAARKSFVSFSTAVTDLARTVGLPHAEALHVFECPMAPVIGTGRWLQRGSEMKNPFFGKPMKDCGTELDAPSAPAASPTSAPAPQASRTWRLPPGHPPIGEVSVVDFLRSEAARRNARPAAAAGGESCGSCGMTAAAMAAGEPCEHSDGVKPAATPAGI